MTVDTSAKQSSKPLEATKPVRAGADFMYPTMGDFGTGRIPANRTYAVVPHIIRKSLVMKLTAAANRRRRDKDNGTYLCLRRTAT